MINKIIVPVDGSEHAKHALDTACELAVALSAEIGLLHVMSRIGSGQVPAELQQYAKVEHINITEHDLLQNVAERILAAAEQQVRQKNVTRVTTALREGNPAQQIVEYAKESDADLIVMGSRGLNDLGGLLLGSVSHKVSHLAGCGCLLVK